jgi:GNAT superfamily N-acetyltransferase
LYPINHKKISVIRDHDHQKSNFFGPGLLSGLFDQYRVFYNQPSDIPAAKKFITERIQQNDSTIFVAFRDGKMIGFTQLYPIFSSVGMKRAWLLNDLFVAEEARGSGAADELLKAAQQMGADTFQPLPHAANSER